MPDQLDFDAFEMLRVLERHEVEYVVIGGLAAVLHGSPTYTSDADICPRRTRANLERLARALTDLDARIRTSAEPEGLPFARDAEFLERMAMVNMVTRAGSLDISFAPAAFAGYDDLARNALDLEIEGVHVKVASLHDVIMSKETANRLKDQAALPYLYALEEEIAEQERERRGR
ncbi:MAG: DUF6036 family nucleotidyltransferase [Actinomycetota bacterium]